MGEFFISSQDLAYTVGTAGSPVVIDVRRHDAYVQADRMLPSANWRDHTSAASWASALPPDLPIVVYCVHGHNVSQLAAAELRTMGRNARVLAGGIHAWEEAGLPTISMSGWPPGCAASPSRWVTRLRPKIDRIACPWLISRFIDRDAVFQFVESTQVLAIARELGAISYDIEGASFAHDGPLCTFDTIIRAFGIADPALDALARIVRAADTTRLDLAPEAAGLLAVSIGISALAGGNDHAALTRGFPVYDALYAGLREHASDTHTWPGQAA